MDAVSSARITVVVDNHVDMLLTDTADVKRFGLFDHFTPPNGKPICTENGVAIWLELRSEELREYFLFDTSLTPDVILHNIRALGLSPDQLRCVAISHGHPDHFGGLIELLRTKQAPVDVAIHPDAFLPKYFIDDEGEIVMKINRGLERRAIEEAGGRLVESREARQIGNGIWVTGEIPRGTAFEPPVPVREGRGGVYLERDGQLVDDEAAIDDQAVVVNVSGKGLVILTACGHSGVVNTVRYAQELTGVSKVHAIMGGFHTGFPGVPGENAEKTVAALKEFEPRVIAPMHCAGLRTIALTLVECPDQFLHNVVGTTLIV